MERIQKQFSYYDGSLKDFISDSLSMPGMLIKRIISEVSQQLVDDLEKMGVEIDLTWKHTMDNSAVRHAIKIGGRSAEGAQGTGHQHHIQKKKGKLTDANRLATQISDLFPLLQR